MSKITAFITLVNPILNSLFVRFAASFACCGIARGETAQRSVPTKRYGTFRTKNNINYLFARLIKDGRSLEMVTAVEGHAAAILKRRTELFRTGVSGSTLVTTNTFYRVIQLSPGGVFAPLECHAFC